MPLSSKRKLALTDLEVPDSDAEDDEDYGWADEDAGDMPPMPPQWQGSEDILIPPVEDLDDEEECADEDEDDALATVNHNHERIGKRVKYVQDSDDSEDELA